MANSAFSPPAVGSSGIATANIQDTAGQITHGALVLSLVDAATFSWVAHGVLGKSNTADMVLVAGSKSLSAELDRLRVTTVSGSGNFDAGTINIQYEF